MTIYLFEVSTQCSIDGSFIFVELLLKQQNKAESFRMTNKMTQTFTEAVLSTDISPNLIIHF